METIEYTGIAIFKAEDLLYPQYDLYEKLDKFILESKPWAKKEAVKLLEQKKTDSYPAHPDVVARWEELANDPTIQDETD